MMEMSLPLYCGDSVWEAPCPEATMWTVRLLSAQSRWELVPSSEEWTPRDSGKEKESRVRSVQ